MKKRLYKLLAFALSVCMVVGLMPAMTLTARAEDSGIVLGYPYKVENAETTFTFPKASVSGDGWKTMTVSISGTGASLDYTTNGADKANAKGDNNNAHQFAVWTWPDEGGKSGDEVATILKNIVFTKGSTDPDVTVELSKGVSTLPEGATVTEGTDDYAGHYYLFVKYGSPVESWLKAYNAAKGTSFMGMKGYLATLKDEAESNALKQISTQQGWVGGSALIYNEAVDGDGKIKDPESLLVDGSTLKMADIVYNNATTNRPLFYWACGPEAGETINENLWNEGEPNATQLTAAVIADKQLAGFTKECCAKANDTSGSGNKMNDVPAGNAAGASAQYAAFGYFVEFGGYTETPDPGYGGEEAPESAKTEPAVTVSDSTLKGPMQTFTLPEGTVQASGNCLFSQDDAQHKIVIDPEGDGDATVTLKPTDGQAYDQTKVNAWLESKTTGVTAEVNPDGSVTLTFTQASKYQTSGDMSGLATAGQKSIEAKIDGNIYSTVADALKAANGGNTVELQMNSGLTPATDAPLKSGVTLKTKGAEDGEGSSFKATGDGVKVDVTADGKVTMKDSEEPKFTVKDTTESGSIDVELGKTEDGKVSGTVTLKDGGAADINGTEYKIPADNSGKTTKLNLVTDESGEDPHVELTEGSVEVPASGKITVNGKEVEATDAAVTVTKDAESGKAEVKIESGKKATIGGVEYTGEATVVLDEEGNASVAKGTVNLPSSEEGAANGETNVDFGDGNSVHVKNAASETGKDVTVTVPGDTEGTGKATMPQGGAVTIGPKDDAGKTYTATQNDTELEFDKNGDVTLKKGGVELGTGDAAVKFGGKDITGTNGSESGKVKVEVEGEKAKVTVPKGGSVTIGDTTYTNKGDGELELEVDSEGNVTLKKGTVDVPADGKIKVGDKEYTAGSAGATLTTEDGNEPATLTQGSVEVPKDGSVKVGDNKYTAVSENVVVSVDESGKATVSSTDDKDIEVKFQKGSEAEKKYLIPEGKNASENADKSGLDSPAIEALTTADSEISPDNGVKVAKSADSETDVYREGNELTLSPNSSVDVTTGTEDTEKTTIKNESAENTAHVTVGDDGTLTLKDGKVTMTDNSDPDGGSLQLGETGKTLKSKNATVTMPGTDAEGNSEGADVEVPNDGKVTIGDKKYTAKEEGTKLHVDEDGTVTLVAGSIEIPEGQTFEMDGVTYTGEVTVKKEAESGKFTATFGAGSSGSVTNDYGTVTPGSSGDTLTVNNGLITGTISNGGKVTNSDGDYVAETSADVTVSPRGKVTLNDGSIKTPAEGGSVTVSSGEDESPKDYTVEGKDVTVTKGSPSSAKVGEGGTLKVTEGENTTEYTAPTGKTAEVQLTKDGPVLKDGAVELDNGEAIGVNGATVETTADKVTVTKESDGGNATVDIPEGAKAKINGVEVEGPANVEIDSSGKATVTPTTDGGTVTVGGVKYKDAPETEGKVTITADGDVSAENMAPSISAPTDGPVFVPEGTSVSFEVDGKTTVITGGEGGGYITVDGSGNVTVTDESGAANYGTYSNASDDDLRLTISSNEEDPATLTGGTVRAEKDSPVKVGEHTYTPGDDGMTLKYNSEEDDNTPTLTDGSVIPEANAPVKVGENTYTPQSNNVEIGMGTGNGSVKSNDGEDAQVQFQHNSEGAKDYLIPGTADAVSGTDDKLPSPAQEKLGTSDTNLGSDESGAKIKGDEGNTDGKNAYFESKEAGGGNLTLQPGAKATVTPAGDEAGSKATTYENADPEKDAKLTLDKDGNATLTEGTVTMTGDNASLTVDGIEGDKGTVTGNGVTVTAPGKNAEGENIGGADVKVPASGSVEIGGKTYSNAGSDELELHVDKDGNVSVKSGKVELADDSSIKYGNTDITNPTGGTDGNKVTVEATEGKANVTVPGGTSNSVKIGDNTYTNADESNDLKLEVAPNGEVYLNSGKVQVQDGARVTLPVNDGFQHFVAGDDVTVEKTEKSKYKVTVPEDGSAVFNSFEIKDHSGSGIELEITTNGAALTNGSADIGTNMELTVSNAKVKNAGPGDVTVTADPAAIDIPAGTTATVNGVEVKGPAKVTVGSDGNASVKPGAGNSATVGGVTYTDDGSGEGEITINKEDGKVTASNMSAAIEKLPVEGLVVPAGQTLTYKAGGKDVTLKGGASDSKIDIAANGDITMESGDLTIKGDVTTQKAAEADEDTKWQYVGDVTLKLTDEDGKAVEGVTKDKLTVKKANGEEAGLTDDQIVVNDDGTVTLKDVPYGSYTVEVKDAEGKVTGSTTVTVNGASTTSSMTVETEITVKTEVTGTETEMKPATENLEDEVKPADRDKADEGNVEVTITLNVDDASSDPDKEDDRNAINAEVEKLLEAGSSATDAVTDYVDVTVKKQVTVGSSPEPEQTITNTSSLITMRFPLSTKLEGKVTNAEDAEKIFVFRYHDGSAAKMRKVSPSAGKTANFECYYIEVSPDSTGAITVVVKANKFSVYAFGVADSAILPQDPSTGGGGGVVAYPVTLPESVDNGTVSANYSSAAPGVTVTLTVTPDDGYTMGSITITDRNGNIIPVTDNGDGTYSFRMPSGGVEVSISFKLSHCDGGDDCPSRAFPDLDVTAWYHEYTDYVIETKLMQGSGGLFKPNGTLTRAEMVTVLWNMNGRGVVNYLMTYGDVSEEDWYAEAIRWATSEGVVDGYDNGNFGPNDKITREQMAKMLYNYEKKYGDGGFTGAWMFPLPFADTAKINDWAYEAVAWCYMDGVINGKDGNVFDPAGNALRCELAKVLTVYNQIDD